MVFEAHLSLTDQLEVAERAEAGEQVEYSRPVLFGDNRIQAPAYTADARRAPHFFWSAYLDHRRKSEYGQSTRPATVTSRSVGHSHRSGHPRDRPDALGMVRRLVQERAWNACAVQSSAQASDEGPIRLGAEPDAEWGFRHAIRVWLPASTDVDGFPVDAGVHCTERD